MIGRDFITNSGDFHDKRSRFSWRQVDVFLWPVEILWWQVKISMMTDRDFHGDWSRFYYEGLRFSWWCLSAPSKFQSLRGVSHHPTLKWNCHTMQSHVFTPFIQWMVYYLCVIAGVWSMRAVAVTLVVFGENGFIVKTNRGVA